MSEDDLAALRAVGTSGFATEVPGVGTEILGAELATRAGTPSAPAARHADQVSRTGIAGVTRSVARIRTAICREVTDGPLLASTPRYQGATEGIGRSR